MIIEFRVDDVDAEYARLEPSVSEWVLAADHDAVGQPLYPFRDPDGNLVNLFTPVTEEAIKKLNH